MRKLSKILAVILTVGILAGIIAITAAASTPRENNLIPDVSAEYLETYSKDDYEDGTFDRWAQVQNMANSLTSGNSHRAIWSIKGDSTNKYMNFVANTASTSTLNTNGQIQWRPSNWSTSNAQLYDHDMTDTYDYLVVDFDFGTDSYKVQIGYHIVTTTASKTVDTVTTVTYTHKMLPLYKTYTASELTESAVLADVAAAADDFAALVESAANGATLTNTIATDSSTKESVTTTVAIKDLGFDLDNDEKYAWTVEDAMASKTLAFVNEIALYPYARAVKDRSQTTYSAGRIDTPVNIYILENNGVWYYSPTSTYNPSTAVRMNLEVGTFDHITYIAECITNVSGDTTTYTYKLYAYINGVYFNKATANSACKSFSVDICSFQIPAWDCREDAWSLCVDNITSNYYKKGYRENSACEIDDLIASVGAENELTLYDISDVVYNEDYVSKNYVTYNGVNYYNDAGIRKLIKSLSGYKTLTANRPLYDLEVSDDLESLMIYGGYPVSAAPSDRPLIVANNGNNFEIREVTEEDVYNIEWYDMLGNLICTTTEIFGNDIDTGSINPDYADKENGIIYDTDVEFWEMAIGDSVEPLRPVEFGEVDTGATIQITAFGQVTEIKNVLLYVGEWSEETELVRPILSYNNDWAAYQNSTVSVIKAVFEGAKHGDTVVLTSDLQVGGLNSVAISEGENISFDLNGFDLLRIWYSKSQPSACFSLREGSVLNIYSSREGGRIFDTGWYKVEYTDALVDGVATTIATEDTSYSAGGFIVNALGVDGCEANVGAFRGYEANLEYNGGSLFYGQGYNYTNNPTRDRDEYINDVKMRFSINGGNYYMPVRCAYAFATTTGPDVVWDFKNADFYVSQSVYALLHDYDDGRFSIKTEAYIDNCNIITLNADNISREIYKYDANTKVATPIVYQAGNIGDYGNIYHTIGARSDVYITNTNAIGKLASKVLSGGMIHLGEGNVINTTINYKGISYIDYIDGAYPLFPASDATSFEFTLNFAHPKLYADYEQHLELVGGAYKLIDGIFDEDVSLSCTKYATFITVKGNKVPELAKDNVAAVNWYAPDNTLYKTTYAFVGDPIEKIAAGDFEVTELDNGWYDLGYGDWRCVTEGQSSSDAPVAVKDKENKFVPKMSLIADIDGTMAKMSFYYSQYEFYFYFPKPKEGSGVIYIHDGSDTAETYKTGWFVSQNLNESSLPYSYHVKSDTVTKGPYDGYLKTSGDYYYNWFYPNQDASEIQARAIRFRVEQYDLDGDGIITDDEKNIPLQQNVNISIPRYATILVNTFGHGSEETILSYNLMRYMMECRDYMGKDISFFEEYEAAYFAKCDCAGASEKKCDHIMDIDDMDLSEETSNMGDLTTYLHSANFNLNISKPTAYIYLLPIEGSYTITASVDTLLMSGNKVVAGTESISVARDTAKDVTVKLPDGSSVKLLAYKLGARKVFWLTGGINFTITADYTDEAVDDVTVNGTYGLADYVNNNPGVRAAKALYAFAWAAWDYKTVTESEKQ